MIKLIEILGELAANPQFKVSDNASGIKYFNLLDNEGKLVSSCFGIEKGDSLHITSVSTDEDLRGQGNGTFFLNKIIDWAKNNNYKKLTLDVLVDNTGAANLYKKLGFKVEGNVYDTNYPENDHYKMIKLLEIANKAGLNIDFGSAQQKEMKYIGPESEYFHHGHLLNAIILGKYTTFVPHGGQSEVLLFPTAHFADSDWGHPPVFDKEEVKSNIGYLEGLIKQGQYKVIK